MPVVYQGKDTDYNFYLRNDPRKIESGVPLDGEIIFRKNMVLNVTTENLFCDGDWSLAIGNMQNLYGIMGISLLVWNESVEYLPVQDYMFVTFNEANVTEIKEKSGNSYELNVNDCEVLAVAERLMVETFLQFKELNG